VGSGKSALIAFLRQKPALQNFAVFQKDAFRDGTMAREHEIKAKLIAFLQKEKNVILETTGGGVFAKIVEREIRHQNFAMCNVYNYCSTTECLRRIDNRPSRALLGYNYDLREHIWEIASAIQAQKFDIRLNAEQQSAEENAEILASQLPKFWGNLGARLSYI